MYLFLLSVICYVVFLCFVRFLIVIILGSSNYIIRILKNVSVVYTELEQSLLHAVVSYPDYVYGSIIA